MNKKELKDLKDNIHELKVRGDAIYEEQKAEREKYLNNPVRKKQLDKVRESHLQVNSGNINSVFSEESANLLFESPISLKK